MVNQEWTVKRMEIRRHEHTHAETCRDIGDCLVKGYKAQTQMLMRHLNYCCISTRLLVWDFCLCVFLSSFPGRIILHLLQWVFVREHLCVFDNKPDDEEGQVYGGLCNFCT